MWASEDDPEKLKGEWILVSLEEDTCTDRACRYFAERGFEQNPRMLYVPTFKQGVEEAKKEDSRILVVPMKHPVHKSLYYDPNWRWDDLRVFLLGNPPLHLASRDGSLGNRRCATLPTLEDVFDIDVDFVCADNTQHAARMVSSGDCDCCITNQTGKEKYKLVPIETKHLVMAWVPYLYEGNN
ncbi:hypothetical protein KY331_03365 [Candidatus Woesearchaeota archaeon]|nr:hypothetical protein [Candidatus Woesearchaeota archaeon]